jgi:hypothetical protein
MKNIQVIGLMLSLLGLTIGLFGVGTTDPQAHVFVTHILSSKALSTLRGAGSVCGQQICLVQPTDGTCQPVPGDPLSSVKTWHFQHLACVSADSPGTCVNNLSKICMKQYYFAAPNCASGDPNPSQVLSYAKCCM